MKPLAKQNYVALQLMEFKFDQSLGRTKFVKYVIAKNIGLKPKITIDPTEVGEYQKNIDVYGYDVDPMYSAQVYSKYSSFFLRSNPEVLPVRYFLTRFSFSYCRNKSNSHNLSTRY